MAEDTKVHADEPAKKAGEKPATKDGSWIEKHKALAYGGMAFILVVLFFFLRRSASSSSSGTTDSTAAQNGIDPATGYLYGSPADIAALGGSGSQAGTPGPAGATGPTGATGAPGPAGPNGPGGSSGSTSTPKNQTGYVTINGKRYAATSSTGGQTWNLASAVKGLLKGKDYSVHSNTTGTNAQVAGSGTSLSFVGGHAKG